MQVAKMELSSGQRGRAGNSTMILAPHAWANLVIHHSDGRILRPILYWLKLLGETLRRRHSSAWDRPARLRS